MKKLSFKGIFVGIVIYIVTSASLQAIFSIMSLFILSDGPVNLTWLNIVMSAGVSGYLTVRFVAHDAVLNGAVFAGSIALITYLMASNIRSDGLYLVVAILGPVIGGGFLGLIQKSDQTISRKKSKK